MNTKENKSNEKNSKKNNVIAITIFVLLGVLIAMQAKSVANAKIEKEKIVSAEIVQYEERIKELKKSIEEKSAEKALLQDRYNSEMNYLYNNEKDFYELYKKYETDITQYKFSAGLTNVTGAGIDIGLDDAPSRYESTPGLLVHDIYLNEIINTLRAAGAQAIAINGERIVAMSEMLCLGPSIRVNNTKLFAPYHIEAIGNPQELLAAFKASSIYAIMVKENLIVDPIIKENITIKKYSKSHSDSVDLLK